MAQHAKVVHVKTWLEFKKLATDLHPDFVAYAVQNAPLSRPPIGLRLVFSVGQVQYVFLDFANGNTLRGTRLPIHVDKSGVASFKEEDLKTFLRDELNRKDLSIVSFEVLGY